MNVSLGLSMAGRGMGIGVQAPAAAVLPCGAGTAPLLYCAPVLPPPPVPLASMPAHLLIQQHQQQQLQQRKLQHQQAINYTQHQQVINYPQNQHQSLPTAPRVSGTSTTAMVMAMPPSAADSAYASHYASRYASAIPSAAASRSVSPVKRQVQHQPQPLPQHPTQLLQQQPQQTQQQQQQLKRSQPLIPGDSCYASRVGSALHSRAPSPSASSRRGSSATASTAAAASTANLAPAASAAASTAQSRRASRAPSPTAAGERRAAAVSVNRSSPYAVVLPRGQARLLDEASATQLCRRSLQEELESAVRWLGSLDWISASAFEAASDEAAVMEDEFRGSYEREPPTVTSLKPGAEAGGCGAEDDSSDTEEGDAESHIVLADTLLSMVEAAWGDEQEAENELRIAGRPIQAQQRSAAKPKKEDAIYNVRYKTLPCLHWQKNRTCPAGDHCHFAHGPQELRQPQRHPKFKTQVCQNFKRTGKCLFGSRCFFKHTED